jgi:hypothetical protein
MRRVPLERRPGMEASSAESGLARQVILTAILSPVLSQPFREAKRPAVPAECSLPSVAS